MFARLLHPSADITRDKLFWLIASVMVVGQLAALWMLCSYQVRQAELRHATVQVERLAVTECLRSTPGATLNSCAAQLAPLSRDTTVTAVVDEGSATLDRSNARMSNTVPVNYVYQR
jgi:hypothetical protein